MSKNDNRKSIMEGMEYEKGQKIVNVYSKHKRRDELIKTFSAMQEKDFIVIEGTKLNVSVKDWTDWFENGWLILGKNQRGSSWPKKIKVNYLNPAIRGTLSSQPLTITMIIPIGKPVITVSKFIKNCKTSGSYLKEGYRMLLTDGGQRTRTLYGFKTGASKYETEFNEVGKDEDGSNVIFSVKNVTFEELPKDAKERFLKTKLPILVGGTHNLHGEVCEEFDIINSKRKQLSKSESLNNLYSETLLWQAAYKELEQKRTKTLLTLDSEKSYGPCNEGDDVRKTLKSGDNGKAVKALLKILYHVDHPWMNEGSDVNSALAYMSTDSSNEYDTPEKIDALLERYAEILEIVEKFPEALPTSAENRLRSFFAAVSILNAYHSEIFEKYHDEIKEMFTALQTVIPSCQEGSAKASNINNEIGMYVAMIMYVCNIEDKDCLRKQTVEEALVFSLSQTKYNMLAHLEAYYAEKNKVPA